VTTPVARSADADKSCTASMMSGSSPAAQQLHR
jgi:hypothetical protein